VAELVRAAGGLVRRNGTVLIVHRPKYDDWSFPKGKLEAGETEADAARREVEEETRLRCRLGRDLGTVQYHDRFGRPKVVRYWEMTVEDGEFEPTDEVDAVRWATADDAAVLLTYERDKELLDR
jgi:8-oxo-dGTP diphosphatase